ncbi:unnamed protein product [Hermetia illucens]|uniref:Putative ionotropic receptor ligand binding domain-containing protein n=1 Tax=Hermetia illucens TaxID=343691 RepID=A0A7R8V122_HERIL|nr:unnamed protein product [Hermetia illucens]
MGKLPLVLIVLLLSTANSLETLNTNYHRHDLLYHAAMHIIESFDLSQHNTVEVVKIFAQHSDLSTNKILMKVVSTPVRVVRIDRLTRRSQWYYNVFLISNNLEFNILKNVLTDKYFNFDGFFLLIISSEIKDPISFCRNMFNYFFNVYILEVAVLHRPSDSERVNLYTFIPFSENKCDDTEPVLFNFYENGSFQDTRFFPGRINNFHECEITAIAIESPPFVEADTVNGTLVIDKGYEVLLLKQLAEVLNFKLKVIRSEEPKDSPLGQVFKNGTATGPIGMMNRGEANLTLGWLTITKERLALHLLPSVIYMTAEMILIAPEPAPFGPMELLLLPLDSSVWVIILALLTSSVPIAYLLKNTNNRWRNFIFGRNNRTPITNLLSIWVNGWVPTLPKRNFARTLIVLLILSSMVVRSAYQGSVFKFLRSDKRHKPHLHLSYYLHNGYKIYTSERMYSVIKDMSSDISKYLILYSGGETDYLMKLKDPNFKGLILTSIDAYKYYHQKSSYKHKDLLLPRVFFLDKIVMYFRWNSYLKRVFDEAILNIGGSGLFVHYRRSYFNHRVPVFDEPVVAFVSVGWYYLCGMMLALSFFVFLLEIMSQNCIWIQRIMECVCF